MKIFTHILTSPIRTTLLVMLGLAISYVFFTLLSNYLLRVMCADAFNEQYDCAPTALEQLGHQIVNDLILISRIGFELSVITLIAQLIYRLVNRNKK